MLRHVEWVGNANEHSPEAHLAAPSEHPAGQPVFGAANLPPSVLVRLPHRLLAEMKWGRVTQTLAPTVVACIFGVQVVHTPVPQRDAAEPFPSRVPTRRPFGYPLLYLGPRGPRL